MAWRKRLACPGGVFAANLGTKLNKKVPCFSQKGSPSGRDNLLGKIPPSDSTNHIANLSARLRERPRPSARNPCRQWSQRSAEVFCNILCRKKRSFNNLFYESN